MMLFCSKRSRWGSVPGASGSALWPPFCANAVVSNASVSKKTPTLRPHDCRRLEPIDTNATSRKVRGPTGLGEGCKGTQKVCSWSATLSIVGSDGNVTQVHIGTSSYNLKVTNN